MAFAVHGCQLIKAGCVLSPVQSVGKCVSAPGAVPPVVRRGDVGKCPNGYTKPAKQAKIANRNEHGENMLSKDSWPSEQTLDRDTARQWFAAADCKWKYSRSVDGPNIDPAAIISQIAPTAEVIVKRGFNEDQYYGWALITEYRVAETPAGREEFLHILKEDVGSHA